MAVERDADVYRRLARQSLAREFDAREDAVAEVMEQIFRDGSHDFAVVVHQLNEREVPRPSGQPAPWTLEILEAELAAINASFDKAYAERGSVESPLI